MESLLQIFLLAVAISTSDCYYRYTKEPKDPTYAVIGKNLSLQWQYTCTNPKCPLLYAIVFGVPGRYLITKSTVYGTVHLFPANSRNKTIDEHFKGRVALRDGNTLVISPFRPTDAMTYLSKLLPNDGRNIPVSKVTVKAAVPPEFTKVPPNQIRLKEGSSLSLRCEAHGEPTPKITWTKDGMLLSNKSHLNISMVTANHVGVYICEAVNMAGKISWKGQAVFADTGGVTPSKQATSNHHPTGTTTSPPDNPEGSSPSYNKDEGSSSLGIIVGAVVGAVVLVAIAIATFLFFRRRKRRSPKDVGSGNGVNFQEKPVHYRKKEIQALVGGDMNNYVDSGNDWDIEDKNMHYYETAKNKPDELQTHEMAETAPEDNPYANTDTHRLMEHPYATAGSKVPQTHLYESADSASQELVYASADSLHSVNSLPNSHTYAEVDKKNKRVKKKPEELQYADLDLINDASPLPAPLDSPTKYADIESPKHRKPEYYNASQVKGKSGETENVYATIQNPENAENIV